MSSFQIDHIIARKHKGRSTLDNLALARVECNTFKGPNIAGIDPPTERVTRLFHPRKERWNTHFDWAGPFLVGKTRVGRATIEVLEINDLISVMLRQELLDEGVFYEDKFTLRTSARMCTL
jgi:hypothetical protein